MEASAGVRISSDDDKTAARRGAKRAMAAADRETEADDFFLNVKEIDHRGVKVD